MERGPLLGVGQTAEIYAFGDDRVVKQFGDGVPPGVAEREAANTRLAVAAGLPAPAVHAVNEVGERPSIVLDRVRGDTMLTDMQARPWTLRAHARRLAELHARITAVQTTGAPPVHERLERHIRGVPGLDADLRERALAAVADLPTGDALCHGDFHPENVILADEPVVIDWLDAGRGPPAADAARTTLLLRYGGEHESTAVAALRTLFRRWYLRRYCALTGVMRADVRAWEFPVAVARLAENVPEADRLLAFAAKRRPTQP